MMFSRIIRPPVLNRFHVLPIVPASRPFHHSAIAFKKRLSKKTVEVEESEAAVGASDIDFDDLKKKMQSVVEKFGKAANEAKLGKTNPQLFDHLPVKINDQDTPFNTLAQTAVKGRNFIITVFDPANTKHIVSSILGSGLNMTPISDPKNKSTLKVPLPPVTAESKKEVVKHLKEVFEKYRNGPGGHGKNAYTLASIRGDLKKKMSKKVKKSDEETKAWKDFEKIHKDYCDKLQELFKAAETAILK